MIFSCKQRKFLFAIREGDTLVEHKRKKISHEDDGLSKVDIENSNFPPHTFISTVFT